MGTFSDALLRKHRNRDVDSLMIDRLIGIARLEDLAATYSPTS